MMEEGEKKKTEVNEGRMNDKDLRVYDSLRRLSGELVELLVLLRTAANSSRKT